MAHYARSEGGPAAALILAGGLGTRLRAAIADRPKVLATVCGRPFLAYVLDQLVDAGVERAILCTGYLSDQVSAAFGSSYRGCSLAYSSEPEPAGTGGALRRAAALIEGAERSSDDARVCAPVLVLNGDSLCEVDLLDLWEWHHRRPAHVTLALTQVADAAAFGSVTVDACGRVTDFAEKRAGGGLVSAGVYLMQPSLIGRIPANREVSLERELFPAWIRGFGVYGYVRRGGLFMDIGTPESLDAARRTIAQHPVARA